MRSGVYSANGPSSLYTSSMKYSSRKCESRSMIMGILLSCRDGAQSSPSASGYFVTAVLTCDVGSRRASIHELRRTGRLRLVGLCGRTGPRSSAGWPTRGTQNPAYGVWVYDPHPVSKSPLQLPASHL